jgi:hypothetical protein
MKPFKEMWQSIRVICKVPQREIKPFLFFSFFFFFFETEGQQSQCQMHIQKRKCARGSNLGFGPGFGNMTILGTI